MRVGSLLLAPLSLLLGIPRLVPSFAALMFPPPCKDPLFRRWSGIPVRLLPGNFCWDHFRYPRYQIVRSI